jgi:hypothetical protein
MIRLSSAAFLAASATLAACGETCFIAGTRIRTPRGERPIEDLGVGDEVLSFDGAQVVTRRILARQARTAEETFSVRAGDHAIAGVTAEHPFWDESTQAWRPLRSLTLTSKLMTLLHNDVSVVAISELRRGSARMVTVHNLSVDGPEHNYFAENILVHNKSTILCVDDTDCAEGTVCELPDGDGDGVCVVDEEVSGSG